MTKLVTISILIKQETTQTTSQQQSSLAKNRKLLVVTPNLAPYSAYIKAKKPELP